MCPLLNLRRHFYIMARKHRLHQFSYQLYFIQVFQLQRPGIIQTHFMAQWDIYWDSWLNFANTQKNLLLKRDNFCCSIKHHTLTWWSGLSPEQNYPQGVYQHNFNRHLPANQRQVFSITSVWWPQTERIQIELSDSWFLLMIEVDERL